MYEFGNLSFYEERSIFYTLIFLIIGQKGEHIEM